MFIYFRYVIGLCLGLFLLAACGPTYVFEKKYSFDATGWPQADSLQFNVDIPDSLTIYNLYLDVDHTGDYPYQNMYVRIHTIFPDQKRLTERVSLTMAKKTGQWYGGCSGNNCQLRVNIQEGAFFNQAGQYTFVVEQFMRHDTLAGISAVALLIEDTGKSRSTTSPK